MGIENTVFCRICGQKYFPVSLPFHSKVCIKVFQQTHTDCPYCKRGVFNNDWRDHVELCKKLPKKHGSGQGMSVIHTIQSIQKGLDGMADSQGRHPCMVCCRKFTGDRISTHENVCRRRLAAGTISLQSSQDPSHSVDPSKKPKMMTLNDMGRPKSKQVNKMPSLKDKIQASRKKKEVQAFAGSGVRLGTFSEPQQEESKTANKTFTGLKKVNKGPQHKVEFKWRCLNCLTLNKVEENKQCQKCGRGRELSNEEEKVASQEEEEQKEILSQWGNIEELEDQREDLLDLISELELEATPIFISYTLEKLVTILANILKNPTEDKYKVLKMDNKVFYSNIGRFVTGIKLIKFIGFVSIRLDNNKLAYNYNTPTANGIHPLLQIAYDELRTALAKNSATKLGNEESKIIEYESRTDDQDRIDCSFCSRKFVKDRIDKHQQICARITSKPKRKTWDEKKKRLQGTVFENYQPMFSNHSRDRFELCLSRRDISNMNKIMEGLKLSREEYNKRAHELSLDNNWYFRCKQCREIMHTNLTKTHSCDLDYEDTAHSTTNATSNQTPSDVEQIQT